jgi:hypothetical protein
MLKVHLKVILFLSFLGMASFSQGALCHLLNIEDTINSLMMAMVRAKDCSSGNQSGNMVFIHTFAVLKGRTAIGFSAQDLAIPIQARGKIEAYEKDLSLLTPQEQDQVEWMFYFKVLEYLYEIEKRTPAQEKIFKKAQKKFMASWAKISNTSLYSKKHPMRTFLKSVKVKGKLSPERLLKSEWTFQENFIWPIYPVASKACASSQVDEFRQNLTVAISSIYVCKHPPKEGIYYFLKNLREVGGKTFRIIDYLNIADKFKGNIEKYKQTYLQKRDVENYRYHLKFLVYFLVLVELSHIENHAVEQQKGLEEVRAWFEKQYKKLKEGRRSNKLLLHILTACMTSSPEQSMLNTKTFLSYRSRILVALNEIQ